MVATLTESSVIDCREDDGALRDFLRANNRFLHWEEICAELIDNSLEHSGEVCHVSLEWSKLSEMFRAVDNGDGSTDIQAFFKPGKSVQTGRSKGNSTFGVGLFVCECCVSSPDSPGLLRVATTSGLGTILVGLRQIDNGSNVKKLEVPFTDETRRNYGIGETGTSVAFTKFAKAHPDAKKIGHIAEKLGRQYGSAIQSGSLQIDLIRNGQRMTVSSEQLPECEQLESAVINIAGHSFEVQWGVTKDLCRDNGCRMIYGGKFFDASQEPCGDYRLGRFYASIRVPRTIGRDSMDILKRSINHNSIDELFDRLAELFKPELEQSDLLCKADDDDDLNNEISSLLSTAIKKPKESGIDDDGDEDLREFNGRDPNGVGAKPRNSGRKRTGRRKAGDSTKLPDSLISRWAPLGTENGLAVYDYKSGRITFNQDLAMMQSLRATKQTLLLASIAAGHIAKDIEGSEKQKQLGFGDGDFAWIYRVMMERICPASTPVAEATR